MERFRVFHEQTLFPPYWEALKENRCPLCFNKLSIPLKGKMVFCKSKKHLKTFLISKEKLDSLK